MHSIWAVAVNTIKQAVRMKIAAVFIILLAVLLPVMGLSMTGDGTLKGRLQTFVSYGLSLSSLLLCLLTIAVASYSVTSDFEHKQVYTVLTKPIRRFQFLLGKLLGVILLSGSLLILFSAIIYTITIYMPRLCDAGEDELLAAQNEFYTARASLMPTEADVTAEVEQEYDKRLKSGQLPAEVLSSKNAQRNYKAAVAEQLKLARRAAAPSRELVWEFDNVKPLDPNQNLFVRFKYDVSVNPLDLQIYSRWVIGDVRQLRYGTFETPIYDFARKDLIRTFHEIRVPANAVAKDGYLAVAFFNAPQNDTTVIFPPNAGMEVLYKADIFSANYVRAVLLILLRLVFLAALGILAASFLSFPVAMMLCLAVFFTANISGFILESFESLSENVSGVYQYTVRPVIYLLPQFDKISPTKFLVPARLLSWSLLGKTAAVIICVKALLLFVAALLIFGRREIAKTII
jgi:hypothetical protein